MHNIQHRNVREMESMAEIEFLKITLSRYLRLNFLPENRNKIQIDIKVHTSGSSLIQCISEIQYFLHNFFQFGAAPDLKMRRKRNYSNNYEWLKKKTNNSFTIILYYLFTSRVYDFQALSEISNLSIELNLE